MTPSRLDVTESLCNAAIGLLVSWVATYTLLPWWGLTPSPMDAAGLTATFFVISFVRANILRAIFRRLG